MMKINVKLRNLANLFRRTSKITAMEMTSFGNSYCQSCSVSIITFIHIYYASVQITVTLVEVFSFFCGSYWIHGVIWHGEH